jgi:hypothetical protein
MAQSRARRGRTWHRRFRGRPSRRRRASRRRSARQFPRPRRPRGTQLDVRAQGAAATPRRTGSTPRVDAPAGQAAAGDPHRRAARVPCTRTSRRELRTSARSRSAARACAAVDDVGPRRGRRRSGSGLWCWTRASIARPGREAPAQRHPPARPRRPAPRRQASRTRRVVALRDAPQPAGAGEAAHTRARLAMPAARHAHRVEGPARTGGPPRAAVARARHRAPRVTAGLALTRPEPRQNRRLRRSRTADASAALPPASRNRGPAPRRPGRPVRGRAPAARPMPKRPEEPQPKVLVTDPCSRGLAIRSRARLAVNAPG